jgi:hypothetical protein
LKKGFPDANSLKKDDKEQTCHSREQQTEIETASASNGSNEFSILLNEVTNGYSATPARRRLIE